MKAILAWTLQKKPKATSLKKTSEFKIEKSEAAQSCLTLSEPMDCSLPGFSVHGVFQARILEWVAISFSRKFFQPRDWTRVSLIVGRHLTVWAIITKSDEWILAGT